MVGGSFRCALSETCADEVPSRRVCVRVSWLCCFASPVLRRRCVSRGSFLPVIGLQPDDGYGTPAGKHETDSGPSLCGECHAAHRQAKPAASAVALPIDVIVGVAQYFRPSAAHLSSLAMRHLLRPLAVAPPMHRPSVVARSASATHLLSRATPSAIARTAASPPPPAHSIRESTAQMHTRLNPAARASQPWIHGRWGCPHFSPPRFPTSPHSGPSQLLRRLMSHSRRADRGHRCRCDELRNEATRRAPHFTPRS